MLDIIRRIIKRQPITLEELNSFVTSYVEKKLNKVLTAEELAGIINLIQNGFFDVIFAAKQYALMLNYQPIDVVDLKTNTIIKSDIYEL